MPQLIEVRVLGPFRVRTIDGEVVDPRAWRTAKTRDLVRLLAVAGKPVSTERVVDVLWPGAEPARGRGSLRTAASQIRHVLGEDCLVRHGDALELAGVWVDAAAFASRAATARHRLSAGDASGGLAAAWEAVLLYSGDLCEDESYADWVNDDRDRLRRLLRQLLLDAGRAALTAGWFRDAVELGHQALDVDPCAEPAYRVLMRAYVGLGETSQALRTYDHCRHALAEQLGADPDDKTQALHLQLLRPQEPQVPAAPFVARWPMLARVRGLMAGVVEERRPQAVVVTGPAGIGRSRFLQEAAACWSQRVVVLASRPDGVEQPGKLARDLALALGAGRGGEVRTADDLLGLVAGGPLLLVLDDVQWADAESIVSLGRLLQAASQPLLLLAGAPTELAPDHPLRTPACTTIVLPPLAREEVAELLSRVLQGAPSRSLVEELAASSHGRPADLLDAVRDLLGSGQLLSTSDGMVRVPRPTSGSRPPTVAPLLAAARERVGPDGAGVLDLLAVLDRPTTVGELSRISDLDRPGAQLALDQLCDLHLVTLRPAGYAMADPLVREAAYRWLRSSTARDLHRRVAEGAYLPAAVRVEHWLSGGEPALACAAALEAADEALAAGDDVQLRAHLRTVRAFAEDHATDVEDKVLLCERLAEVALRLGRRWEAQELVERAVVLARTGAPGALPRLRRMLGRCAPTVDEALRLYATAAAEGLSPIEQRQVSCLAAAAVTAQEPRRAADMLLRTILAADDAGDIGSQIEARVLLARAAGQRRDFSVAERSAKEAMLLAQGMGDDAMFVRAALALVQTPVFLGDGLRQVELLRRIRDMSATVSAAAEAGDLALTWCVVLHDLGSPEFASTWRQTSAPSSATGHARMRDLLEVHFCLERDQPRRARRLLDELPQPLGALVADDAAHILRARLLMVEHDLDGAAHALRSVLGHRPTGPSLLAPEAGARLAALLATTDPSAAREHLEAARARTGEHMFPREEVLILRANAELLAATGHAAGAATATLAAALTAHRAGLVLHEAEAQARRAALLVQAADAPTRPRPAVMRLPSRPAEPAERRPA